MTSESDLQIEILDNSKEENDLSDDDNSDTSFKLVIESPKPKKRPKKVMNQEDKDMIAEYEGILEKKLEETTAKSNLTLYNVKNILKQVVTNEHVLAMVRQAENPSEELQLEYEPKLTRAKAKELYSSSPLTPLSWISPNQSASESQVLINTEFPEDSSGDEYIPGEEDSEDDRDSSALSDGDHLSQPSTPHSIECATQTHWSEDGVFKVPPCTKNKDDEANISLRTRSKLCLSDTPLEVIEEAFIPPDITTDMYDMECDDNDWTHFLKQFARPLDEVTKNGEDEDHDPEYNVLADLEIDKVDMEELRADKGVKVTRKELNELIDELFQYDENYDFDEPPVIFNHKSKETDIQYTTLEPPIVGEVPPIQPPIQVSIQPSIQPSIPLSTQPSIYPQVVELNVSNNINEIFINDDQKLLLEQQMRQHVQILTQHYLLTYKHPEYDSLSSCFKEYLLNLKHCPAGKHSYFSAVNLEPALQLLESWERKLETEDDEVQEYNMQVAKWIYEVKEGKAIGKIFTPEFPKLILKTISNSSVFIYPGLLPRIPFKPSCVSLNKHQFNSSQNELVALALEQFMPYLATDPYHVNRKGQVIVKHACSYFEKYLLPVQPAKRIYKQISECKNANDGNPINYYFRHNKAPTTVHYVFPLLDYKILPPKDRNHIQLPYLWKEYIYPNMLPITSTFVPVVLQTGCSPQTVVKKKFEKHKTIYPKLKKNNDHSTKFSINKLDASIIAKNSLKVHNKPSALSRRLFAEDNSAITNSTTKLFNSSPVFKSLATSTPLQFQPKKLSTLKTINISKELLSIKFNSSIFQQIKTPNKETVRPTDNMLPSMPMLCTPMRDSPEHEINYDFKPVCNDVDETIADEVCDNTLEADENGEIQKDNLEDINALMLASSTIKNLGKRRPSGSEKKKAKLRREFNSTLRMLSPEDAETITEKENRFVLAFYDKVQEQLPLDEYHKFMEALNDFDEKRNTTAQLYKKVTEAIGPKHADLNEEFLAFFSTLQAKEMGKIVPHLMISNMSLFLSKLEMYFKDQPTQVRKLYRCLSDLIGSKDITSRELKNTIVPLLKGNNLLTDWFLQIFPWERPPNKLLLGAWETVEVGKDTTLKSQDIFETIVIPDVEDPYGGQTCICSCHNVEDVTYKTRSRHCIPCGTRFLQGRVFVQTGKGLRLARITFDDNKIDHLSRLACRTKVKSPSKQISPGKDSQDENRLSSDEEPEKKRLLKTPKKRKPRKKISEIVAEIPQIAIVQPVVTIDCVKDTETVKKVSECSDHNTENTSDSSINEQKQAVEETLEWDCNTSIESIELRLSPDHPSAESESEFCEETSQDNSDSDGSGGDSETNSQNSPIHQDVIAEPQWTRDEDKIILETFQRKEDKEDAFQYIASILSTRTVQQIKERFEMLINLIKQMANSS